jgi:hypothetical protein
MHISFCGGGASVVWIFEFYCGLKSMCSDYILTVEQPYRHQTQSIVLCNVRE